MQRILGLCVGSPDSRRVFSGSARQLFRALDRRGSLTSARSVEPPAWGRRLEIARAIVRQGSLSLAKLTSAWEPAAVRARSRRAAELLRRERGASAALLYGTNFFPAEAGERPPVPVGAALDATFAQIARSGEAAFGLLTPRDVKRFVDAQAAVLTRCDVLFPRSEWCADSLYRDYGIDPVKCIVTGAGPNFDEPLPAGGRRDGRTLLFVGRDWQRKNGPLVVAAFREARRARPDLELKIVGPELSSGPEPGVAWLGPLDEARRAELADWYGRASLLLCPSRSEAFGIVMLEAQAAGCPVLTLDRGAAREIVVDGVTGTRVPDAEPKSIARAILHWVSDLDRLAQGGAAARAHVAKNYTWDLAAERVAVGFEQLAAGGLEFPVAEVVPAPPRAVTSGSTPARAIAREARRRS